jgi:hypothetical protein
MYVAVSLTYADVFLINTHFLNKLFSAEFVDVLHLMLIELLIIITYFCQGRFIVSVVTASVV